MHSIDKKLSTVFFICKSLYDFVCFYVTYLYAIVDNTSFLAKSVNCDHIVSQCDCTSVSIKMLLVYKHT